MFKLNERSFRKTHRLLYCIVFSFLLQLTAAAEPAWKLIAEKNGIKVYLAPVNNSKFKSIRVVSVMNGTISKLLTILNNVADHPKWVYKTKLATLIKKPAPNEFIYYTESILPWPFSNRDAIINLKIFPDTSKQVLRVNAFAVPDYLPKKKGLVRIESCRASWYVTEANNKISIDYTFQIDPGGEMPAWLVNSFADKGPMETFENLRLKLLKL